MGVSGISKCDYAGTSCPGLSVPNAQAKHNIVVAAVVTTVLFTALHGGAFEAGVIPVLNVLTMSLLMTVVLEYSGSIIAPIIMHFLWNGIGALVLDGVSLADDYPNMLITTFTGNEILSGGICKMEGSIIVLFVNVILTALFMFKKISREQSDNFQFDILENRNLQMDFLNFPYFSRILKPYIVK